MTEAQKLLEAERHEHKGTADWRGQTGRASFQIHCVEQSVAEA